MIRNPRLRNREQANNRHLIDPYPVHTLKRVDQPTTRINEAEVFRQHEQTSGFYRAGRGDFGEHMQQEYRRFVPKYPLSGAMVSMAGALADLVDEPVGMGAAGMPDSAVPKNMSWAPMGQVAEKKAPFTDNPEKMARHIKETAYFLRADLVGICELPVYAIYSHQKQDGKPIHLNHKYAIAILIDQDWHTSRQTSGNDWISNSMSFLAYSTSGFIACMLADYIRRLGYPARAHHAMNYQVAVPPILLWAGLGEMCRIGDIVLNPFLGPRFKAAIVTTDLPLAIDKPIDFGLQDFCAKCKKCATECPSGSISDKDKVMYHGYEKWPVDVDKCTKMRIGNKQGSGCGVCIKVCPWNKPNTLFHRSISWTMRKLPFARRFGVWGDDLLGYGKPDYNHKWWLDLETINGDLQVPNSSKNR
ncbi:reductive dehalogenase [bacterium]|nr:reductive dehalogenase [bacterium]